MSSKLELVFDALDQLLVINEPFSLHIFEFQSSVLATVLRLVGIGDISFILRGIRQQKYFGAGFI